MENEEVTPDLLEDIIDSQKQILKELNALKYGDKGANFGEKMTDAITSFLGSWKFIIIQSFIMLLWIIFNVIAITLAFDLYPFILLNLVLSFQAAFATPIILMASNRSEQKDRRRAADAYLAIEHIEGMMERMVGSCKELYNEVNGKDEKTE